ncbi:flagellar basal-body rod protein FlgF [Pinisolibacter aquiterrae]|uniref:flagellar basal-body rod protein FlgF n=1 Tax=Pinisolibacter aquiterrae TaxID=2815579 RepID=UPI001C3CAFB0|nr:flagellar basal-body rod protein FlgF [Pinisolibacter aquiterrae]MBV5265319.1 flagellar basal-body rod protein FlgF [Pinisolibacter aquiterrae]MCC8235353.1 flagellar basal-body rod protein FlgF [Pinisolibacter aquiterrae]
MENAQLVGLSRQIVLRRELDLIANNVANVETNGFKAQALLAKEQRMAPAADLDFRGSDRPISFVLDDANRYDLSAGQMITTGNDLDVAVDGKGWFAVQTAQGERYTRNGSFAIAADGTVVTRDGNPVLTEGGPLVLQPNETRLSIAADGTISTSQGVRGKLRVVDFADAGSLKKVGETLFQGTNPQPATLPRLVQGQLEKSNVRAVEQISRLIEVGRSYEAVASWMGKADELRRNAIEKLAQVA